MIAISFIMFAVLVLAWLIAPNGEVTPQLAKTPSPAMKLGEASV
jgi:hypothetical protein